MSQTEKVSQPVTQQHLNTLFGAACQMLRQLPSCVETLQALARLQETYMWANLSIDAQVKKSDLVSDEPPVGQL